MHSDVVLMKSFLPNENETWQLQDIPPPELDAYLSRLPLSEYGQIKQSQDEMADLMSLKGFLKIE